MENIVLAQLFITGKKVFFSWFFAFILFFSLVVSVVLSSLYVSSATPPNIVTYQGKLLEDGISVTTTKSMAFVIYDSLTGGTALYTASGTLPSTSTISVTPDQGIFSVDLGGSGTNSLDPAIFQDNAELYLEVIVSDTTLSPRKRLTASPYAINSTYLNGVAATSTASSSTYIPISASDGSFTFSTTTFFSEQVKINKLAGRAAVQVGSQTQGVSGAVAIHGESALFSLFPTDATDNAVFSAQISGTEVDVGFGQNNYYGKLNIYDEANTQKILLSATSTIQSYIYSNFYIGSQGTESIASTSFSMGGDDFYVEGDSGFNGNIYTDGVLDVASTGTSTFAGGINLATGKCFAVAGTCITEGASQWTTSGSDIYYGTGNVAIGTTTFGYALNVGGNVNVSGTLYMNGVQTLYRPGEFTGTLFVGNGGASLSHSSGLDGYQNTFVGISSGLSNTTGASNSALGFSALKVNTIGINNSALGSAALFANTIGLANSAFGASALFANTTGTYNSAFGSFALDSNTTGTYNSAFGSYTFDDLTGGSYNIAVGYNTGGGITTGNYNTILGAQVTGLTATLSNNIIIADGEGNQRIRVLNSGYIGLNTTTPAYPLTVEGNAYFDDVITVAGSATSTFTGEVYALNSNIKLHDVLGMASLELGSVAGGTDGFIIVRGAAPGISFFADDTISNGIGGIETNASVIQLGLGNNNFHGLVQLMDESGAGKIYLSATTTESSYFMDSVAMGTTTSAYPLHVWRATDGIVAAFTDSESVCTVAPADGDFSCTSDINLKTNISPLASSLEQIMQLSPVTFNWNSSPNGDINTGFIAQEVESIFPRLVGQEDGGYKTLSQIGLIPFLTRAIQEQQVQIETLTASQSSSGSLVVEGGDLSLNNFSLLNVKQIVGANNKWYIDEFGRLVSNVETTSGNIKSLFGIQSENSDYVISGNGELQNGQVTILFDDEDKSLIDQNGEMRVSITLTGDANGVYVVDKNVDGFTVRELQNGSSNASFDWVVITKRLTQFSTNSQTEESTPSVESNSVSDGGGGAVENTESPTETLTSESTPTMAEETTVPDTESPTETTPDTTTPVVGIVLPSTPTETQTPEPAPTVVESTPVTESTPAPVESAPTESTPTE